MWCGRALFLISADDLFRVRRLVHGCQAACADIERAHNAVDFNAAALDIQHEAAARALLRERHIVAMHGLAFAYFTTTRHMDHPLFFYCEPGSKGSTSIRGERAHTPSTGRPLALIRLPNAPAPLLLRTTARRKEQGLVKIPRIFLALPHIIPPPPLRIPSLHNQPSLHYTL